MLINILFWIITTLIVFPYGLLTTRILRVDTNTTSFFLLTVIGLLPITILAIIWAFFYRVNIEFLLLIISVSLFIYYSFRDLVFEKLWNLKLWWHGLNLVWKLSLLAFVLITAMQAAMPTNIPDNGFYYLQTVKWANEIGIPFGVARFGFQYGQFSSWHILQAVFNLSYFFGNQFNVLNGWLIIMCIAYAVYGINKEPKPVQFFKVFVIFMVVPAQFFNTAPSPDLPVILLSLMVFKILLFDDNNKNNFRLMVILSLVAISIKISSFYLILFIIAFGYKHIFSDRRVIILSVSIVFLLLSKNLITTGNFMFPFDIYTPEWVEWRVDSNILDEGKTIIKNSPLVTNYSEFLNDFSVAQKIDSWFNYKGYRGIANKLWLFGILLLGVIAIIDKSRSSFLVFAIAVIHFAILWVFAPNYRFALAIILLIYYLLFYFFIGSRIKKYTNIILPIGLLSSIIWLTPLIHPIQRLSSNQIITTCYPLKVQYFLMPSKPFVSDTYEKKLFNGEEVFVPPSYHYAWDGPLPCVMRNHYEKYAKKE